jgi:ribosomal protein S18 acetylase RimI-like enzyme
VNPWVSVSKKDISTAEALLRQREAYCVGAAYRFLKRGARDHLWKSKDNSALLVYVHRILFPVFRPPELGGKSLQEGGFFCQKIPLPRFFSFVCKNVHAMQGLASDMDLLEAGMEARGFFPTTRFEYDLMNLDKVQNRFSGTVPALDEGVPPWLNIRAADGLDLERLFPLQLGYEAEEVLPEGAALNPEAVRNGLKAILLGFYTLTAEVDGRLVGKININAKSFTRYQIGGVYVDPDYRGRGIAGALTRAIIRNLMPEGKQFSLFVKKTNEAARRVYSKIGFEPIDDYRICYYK